ncbi:hypothetical protein AAWM_07348 [Aspergillus awamori]|uniref:Uncharacterized protein n=1 Tax=Aspergillus awamori TaxID=105351 RepID=A0A401KYS4_ASPAW|nr:hypothetical protein AAWM_07348 [Aspergillus awamori]
MPLPRPKRQRVARKPESLRSQSTGRSLPPPDHPICDILRLSGRLSCTPVELDGALERIWGKREDEATLAVRARMGLPYTPLEELDLRIVWGIHNSPGRESSIDGDFLLLNACLGIPAKLATTLVLLFASPREPQAMYMALKWQSRSLGGLPTIADISSTASSDLPKQFSQAKKAAIDGKIGKTTVLGVSLVDVEMIERGREGFRVYQAWGEHGYRLDEYLKRGGSQLRSWQEATAFLKSFRKLCHYSGPWTRELKDAYWTCFEIDLDQFVGGGAYRLRSFLCIDHG